MDTTPPQQQPIPTPTTEVPQQPAMQQMAPPPPENTPPPLSRKKTFFFSIEGIGIGLILCILVFVALHYFNVMRLDRKFPLFSVLPHLESPEEKAIATVGAETLYQRDLTTLLQYNKAAKLTTNTDAVFQKLLDDSVILQAGTEENIIVLDKAFYNSTTKSMQQRLQMVEKVKQVIHDKAVHIEGAVVSLKFYDAASTKEEQAVREKSALTKMEYYYNQVKDKTLTIQEAGTMLRQDHAIAGIDPDYQSDSYKLFSYGKHDTITYDPVFDTMLWNQQLNTLTPLYLGKIQGPQNTSIPVGFLFGMVFKKVETSSIASFEEWFLEKKASYPLQRLIDKP